MRVLLDLRGCPKRGQDLSILAAGSYSSKRIQRSCPLFGQPLTARSAHELALVKIGFRAAPGSMKAQQFHRAKQCRWQRLQDAALIAKDRHRARPVRDADG